MRIASLISGFLFRKYRLWVINTSAEAQLYLWDNYKRLLPHIDALVCVSPAKAFIRSFQSLEGESRFLGFGRMSWTQGNNEKWTKKYRVTQFVNAKVTFHKTQIWAPDWNIHSKTGVPPDIFIELYNYENDHNIKEGFVVAIQDSVYRKYADSTDTAIGEICKAIPESTLSLALRSWHPGGGFPNQIQDINIQEISKIVNKA